VLTHGGHIQTETLPTIQTIYRQAQIAKAEKAVSYAKFLERFTASIVRDVAATDGRWFETGPPSACPVPTAIMR
jgi:hypothetical protein